MKEEELLDALAALCEDKGSDGTVKIEADVLVNAHKKLKETGQLRKELEMARDEAQGMKPSVARKLNEKIRALEAELETLRTNKKVSELERKVKFLEHELKQSYTTKNFTLKSGLLELEKQYRAHMNVDPAMAAFWADVTVLLDDKKDKEFQPPFKGPPKRSSDGAPPCAPSSATSQPQQHQEVTRTPVAQPAQTPATEISLNSRGASAAELDAAPSSLRPEQQRQVHSHPAGVLQQVEAFNSIISDEAAGAASVPAGNDSSSVASQGDMVVRQAGGFRIVKSQQQATPAAVALDDVGGTAASSSVAEEAMQPVRLLADSYSSLYKNVTFRPLPAYLSVIPVSPISQRPTAPDSSALQSCRDSACRSVAALQQVFDQLPAGSYSDVDQLQQQMQRIVTSAQQLQGVDSATHLHQQHQIDALLSSVQQLSSALHQASADGSAKPAVEAAQQQLTSVQHELHGLQQLQQHAFSQPDSQQLLVHIFGDFIQQLEQQGVMASSNGTTAAADDLQHHILLQLLQQFLQVNPQVPQLLAARLPAAPAAPAAPGSSGTTVNEIVQSSSDAAVQQPVDRDHATTQTAEFPDVANAATQSEPLPSPTVHASTQSVAVPLSAAETQYDTTHVPPVHVSTQVAAEQATAGTQAEGAEVSNAMTQSEALLSPTSHVAVQASLPLSSVHTQIQADLKPQMSEAQTQADLTPPLAAAEASPGGIHMSTTAPPVQETLHDLGAGAEVQPPAATAATSTLEQDQQQPSGSVMHSRSEAELSVSKAAVGQQGNVLDHLQRHRSTGSSSAADNAAGESSGSSDLFSAVLDVKAEEALDIQAVSKELSQLRADNMELAESLQVTKSLVDHLNSSMKAAIDKADDAEAEVSHARAQLKSATTLLQQLQSEHADVTKLLIDAKVEIAEKKGELLKLVRGMRRAVESPSNPSTMVKELQGLLAVLPASEGGSGELEVRDSIDTPTRLAVPGSSGGLAGLRAGIGQALSGGGIGKRNRVPSDSGTAAEGGSGSGGGRRISEQ